MLILGGTIVFTDHSYPFLTPKSLVLFIISEVIGNFQLLEVVTMETGIKKLLTLTQGIEELKLFDVP